jgi:carbonic anhydrase/acetyltransferase-like protein (isoleucine patch superfamily)
MPLYSLPDGLVPQVAPDAYIAPDAQIIGAVEVGARASIWFGCVLRGDVNTIHVGQGANIQDGTIVHVSRHQHPTRIGDFVLVGHQCIIHGCYLEDYSFVGLGACVMDGCVVESRAMLAAGSLLTPGKRCRAGTLWAGRPAQYIRDLKPEEIERNQSGVMGYVALAKLYQTGLKRVE